MTSDFEKLKIGLPAIIDRNTRILVLGSLPSDESIEVSRYYANPDNLFWSIIYGVFDAGNPHLEYAKRLDFLKSVGVGLWDVLHAAKRGGSLDSEIRDQIPNDINRFLLEHSQVEKVLIAGTKAWSNYKRYCKAVRVAAIRVPSSSATPGRNVLPLEGRINRWREAIIGNAGSSNNALKLTPNRG